MNDFKSLIETLSKISAQDIGKHLSTFTNLYLKPIKTWKRIISYRNESYELYILYVIYYAVIISFLIDNTKYVIPFTILELTLTLLPFSFLIIPFLFYRRIWNKRINSNRLFRLTFVLKIQFNLILILGLLLYKWTLMESIFILVENYIWVVWLALISIFPLILKLNILQKTIWIFSNYISSLLFLTFISYVLTIIPDSNLLERKIGLGSPTFEHIEFQTNYQNSDLYLNDRYLIATLVINKDSLYVRNTQFATIPLVLEIMKLDIKNSKTEIKYLNSLIKSDTSQISNIQKPFKKLQIKTHYLDSLRLNFNKRFNHDFKLTDSLSKASKFRSNKKLYRLINKHLDYYDSIYTSEKSILKIISTKPQFLVRTEQGYYVGLYELKDKDIIKNKTLIRKTIEDLEHRENYSLFFLRIYTFPIHFFY